MPNTIAIIGRVGFHSKLEKYGASRIKAQRFETPFGMSNPVHFMIYKKVHFMVLSRHGESTYDISAPYVNHRANLWALKSRGAEKIISISAPGSLKENLGPGCLVIPDDIIDRTNSPHRTFFEEKGIGVIRMNEPFCPSLRALFTVDFKENFNGPLHINGVYIATAGPRLETRAEIKEYRQLNGDLVGMAIVPEVFLARELEICYGAVCYPVNLAEGIVKREYQRGVLFEGLATDEELKTIELLEDAIPQLVLNIIPKIEVLVRDCNCAHAMKRFKIRGDLPDDFSDWF